MSGAADAVLRTLPPLDWPAPAPPGCALSVVIPARRGAHLLGATVGSLDPMLREEFGSSYEFVVVVNGSEEEVALSLRAARELATALPGVRLEVPPTVSGKGAAVRWGVRCARGGLVAVVDADLPFGVEDLRVALREARAGAEFVAANRRLAQSWFRVPVPLLPLVYRRHRAGLLLNAVGRSLLGIGTTDTQAGMKVFSRRFARAAFRRITCPGFLYDVELFVVARAMGVPIREFPVELTLRSEESTVNVLRESAIGAAWLCRILANERRGQYAAGPGEAP